MGLFSAINHLWSNADFWDKQENAKQNADYAAQQEEERKRRQQQQQQQAQAQAAAAQRSQQSQQPQTTVGGLFGNNPLAIHNDAQDAIPHVQQPGQLLQPTQLPSFNEAANGQPSPLTPPATIKNPYTGEVSQNPFAVNPATGKINGFHPQKGQPGYEFTPEGQADLAHQHQVDMHNAAVAEAPKLQSTPYKESIWGKIANYIPIVGSNRQVDSLSGIGSNDPIQENVTIAKNTGLTIDQINQLHPDQRQQILDQLHKAQNVAKVAQGADVGLTATSLATLDPFELAGGEGGRIAAITAAKQIAKQYAEGAVKRTAIGAGTGMGIDAAAQQYETGHIDPTQTIRSGVTSGLFGFADPFGVMGKHGNVEEATGRPPIVNENTMPRFEAPDVATSTIPTEAPEVAPGVKAPNLMKPQEEAPMAPQTEPVVPTVPKTAPVEPTPAPTPVPTVPKVAPLPAEAPTLPSLERNIPAPQGAVPTGVTHQVPTIQTISPEIQKAVAQARKQVQDSVEQPPVKPQKVAAAAVETPTKAASQEVIANSTPAAPAEVVKPAEKPAAAVPVDTAGKHPDVVFAEKQVQAAQERLDYLKREGEPTKEAEAQLAAAKRDLATTKADTPSAPVQKPVDAVDKSAPKAPAKTVAPVEKTVPVSPETEKPNVAKSNVTPVKPRLTTQAAKDAHEKARVAAVKQAEAETAAKAEKVAAPTKEEAAQHAQDVYHDAQANTTKSGKVSAAWKKKAMAEAGTDPQKLDAVRSAIEKIEGRQAPSETPKEAAGGIALSGKKGISKSGDVIDTTSKEAATNLGKSEAAKTDVKTFLKDMAKREKDGEAFGQKHYETAADLQKKVDPGSPEFHALGDVMRKSGTQAAQTLTTRAKNIRENGTAQDIVNHYLNKLRDNTGKQLTNEDVKAIYDKTVEEVNKRVAFNKAQKEYLDDPSSAEKKQAAIDAKNAKDAARKSAIVEEMKTTIAQKGGDRATQAKLYKMVDQLSKKADVWQMDYVDSSLLSSTGTWTNNFINSGLAGLEESLFGRLGAKIARKTTGTDIGGGGVFSRKSQKFGFSKLNQEYKARTDLPSKNIVGRGMNRLKNLITTANELGNTQIDAQAHNSVKAEYLNILKKEYPDKYGKDMTPAARKELNDLAEYHAVVDPRDLRQKYTDFAFKVQGMGSVLGKGGKSTVSSFENRVTKGMSTGLQSVGVNKRVADNASKLTVRSLIGFPTIVTRSAAQGGRRLSGGAISFIQAARTEDPIDRAMLIKQGVKELGSGGAMIMAGYAAGMSGAVTGTYPSDKTTQDEWAKEGKSEHSVKIGGSYYSIPRALGPFAIPFLVGAQMGQSHSEGKGAFGTSAADMTKNVLTSIGATTPTSQIADNLTTVNNLLQGDTKTATDNGEKIAGNILRISAPASGLLNEFAQDTSKNQKDTSADNPVEAVLNKLYSGLPGLNQHLADKTAKDGTPLKNTNPLARAAGAQSTENVAVVAADKKEKAANASSLSPIVSDKEIYGLLDKDTQHLIDQANNPKTAHEVTDQNYQSIYKAVEKTTDVLAEKGSWDSYGKSLQLKLDNQNKDKSIDQATKDATSRQITQAKILKDNKIDPQVFHLYSAGADKGGISESDFKKMLDPESGYFDKTTAEKLWQLDQLFTEAGVSGNTTGAMNPWMHQKYALPTGSGSGGGGGGKNEIATDFGSVKSVGGNGSGSGGQAIKATQLADFNSLVPNLAKQSASTNLKKSIRVREGVKLY